MDRVQRLRTVVAAAQKHPVYAQKLSNVDVQSLTPERITSLPLTTRQEWLAHIQANPQPPKGAALMHLTPSPAIGWMPEYLSAEDVEYQAQALSARCSAWGWPERKPWWLLATTFLPEVGCFTRLCNGLVRWFCHMALVRPSASCSYSNSTASRF